MKHRQLAFKLLDIPLEVKFIFNYLGHFGLYIGACFELCRLCVHLCKRSINGREQIHALLYQSSIGIKHSYLSTWLSILRLLILMHDHLFGSPLSSRRLIICWLGVTGSLHEFLTLTVHFVILVQSIPIG